MPRRIGALLLALALLFGVAPSAGAEPIFVAVRAHVQEVGWQPYVADSQTAGTTGRSLRLEAIELRGGVGMVSAHVQDIGWMPAVPNGTTAGTTGRSLRMEAVRVRSGVAGWGLECRAHVQDVGWTAWVGDGQTCGTTGRSKRLEAVQLRLTATGSQPAEPTGADSNRAIDQTAMLIGFDALKAQPGRVVLNANDATTVAINNADYNTARGQLAVKDEDSTRLSSVSIALGPKLKRYLDELTNEGKLPKFRALLANSATKMQTPNSSSEAAKEYFGTTRPFRNAALDIKRVPNAGDAYDLGDSRDFPSGHSRIFQVYAASLAVMVPEKAPELLQRGADGAHSRAVLGVHSALGVMGGKAVGTRMVAQRLNDPVFYRDVFEPAMRELRTGLEAKCGTTIAACADGGNATAAKAEVRERLTYGLPRIGQAGQPLAVPYGAEALLRTAHPDKTPEQRRAILAATAIDSGYPLDLTGTSRPAADVGWSRIDLAAALTR